MPQKYHLYPGTIPNMEKKLEYLRERFPKLSVTGSNTRLMNPERISVFEEIRELEMVLAAARPLKEPSQIERVEIGHQVTIMSDEGDTQKFHLCTGYDVRFHPTDVSLSGRLLSVESQLGKALLGKRVSDTCYPGGEPFIIKEIANSPLVGK